MSTPAPVPAFSPHRACGHRVVRLLGLLALGAARAGLAAADGQDATSTPPAPPAPTPPAAPLPADLLIVTADRQTETVDATTATTDVVDQDRMREQGYALNPSDYLRSVPGVAVLDSGGIDGGIGQIRLRGTASESDTAILLDGIPLYDPGATNGSITVPLVTVPGLTRIEVVRGPQSSLYGTQAVGGVLNFQTARPTSTAHADGEAEVGSFDTGRVEGWASGPLGSADATAAHPPLGFAVGIDGLSSKGFNEQTTNPDGDPSGEPRQAVRRIGTSARVEARPDDRSLLYASGYYSNVFQAYGGYIAPSEADFHRLELTRLGAGGSWGDTTTPSIAVDYAHTRLIRNEVDISYGDSSYDSNADFIGVQLRSPEVAHTQLTLGADGNHQQAVTSSVSDHGQTLAALYLRGAYTAPALDADAVVRHDDLVGGDSATTGRLGLAWWPVLRHLRLHTAVGSAFSAPTLDQRYGIYPGPTTFSGNPDLAPQTSRSAEAGIDVKPTDAVLLAMTAFATHYHQRIVAVYDALGNGTLENESSSSRVQGLESELAWDDRNLPWALHASATWLHSRDDTGNRFVLVPGRSASADATLRSQDTWLLVGVDALAERSASDGTPMAGYATLHAAVGWRVVPAATVYVRGENLLNHHYATDQYQGFDASFNPVGEFYYTGTPRSVYGGVEARF